MSKISELLNGQECNRSCHDQQSSQTVGFVAREDKLSDAAKEFLKKNPPPDMVSHPPHYQVEDMTYEPIKVINAWGLNFNIGSAVKYLSRYRKKFNAIEDLKKAIFYIQDEINRLEAEHKDNK